ncbi:Benzoate--CoA ligase [Fundidesulfovibrio magnetotacticus]|uniref:Benzoate--CoA ligase n=1 Tax=Fundidesulfovibrio magnetotacticus TaxID=2730080 RepID=A0A6V8LW87_9BACT|nr:benzoate-CoA ligase family protein [Fundidesulfovibrio magnetotacticus]GFK93927.1 Benzoate--CoA ligase [Fundidesulfovibrio magnetotacticus]
MMEGRNAAWDLLELGHSLGAERTAYLFGGSNLTYGALKERSLRFASYLDARGVRPGERVLLVLPDTPAFVCAFLGAMLAGACPVPVNTTLKPSDYAFLLEDSGARLLLTVPGHPSLEAAGPDRPAVTCGDLGPPDLDEAPEGFAPRPADPAHPGFMLYSSGSTGNPKGVPHAQENLLVPHRTWGRVLELGPSDVVFSSSKLFFAYGLLASLALPLAAGAATALFPGKPGPGDAFDLMALHRPTAFFGVPTLYNAMLRVYEPAMKPFVPALCYSAGEALPPLLHEEWLRLAGREILDGIGSTEAFNVFVSNRKGRSRAGSAGQPVPGFEVRLVDDEGGDAPPGSEGHLLIRGEGLCRGYWNRPDKTREAMLPGGWLRTGDVFVEEGGFFSHRGRSDDMLKSGGQWVSPVRVEEELLRHPAVAECAVAARRAAGAEVVCAFVVPAPGAVPGKALDLEWRRFLLERLPQHMCPARFECVSELPRTSTGKVRRFVLRQG